MRDIFFLAKKNKPRPLPNKTKNTIAAPNISEETKSTMKGIGVAVIMSSIPILVKAGAQYLMSAPKPQLPMPRRGIPSSSSTQPVQVSQQLGTPLQSQVLSEFIG